ncbi:hypothetical protein DLJ46_05195 [Micromonospora globispora]|uniref:PPC domain-containing protein n=1 Tax=Micromonospora globispora TaxID=1450148 RepID=A0A317KEF7_9ACTN|nr:DUF296 domain-containing protein [Micromonospora globispora]PWU51363.1 hypothetical protein DLJ46_05195 [Micromonospora globispora]
MRDLELTDGDRRVVVVAVDKGEDAVTAINEVAARVREQVEVLSLLGDIADNQGKAALHVHALLGHRDGTTVGGHLLHGEVWPTLEVISTEVGASLTKRVDPETGLALLTGTAQR